MSTAPAARAIQEQPNPRRPRRDSYRPKPETLALLKFSGNPINGLGESTRADRRHSSGTHPTNIHSAMAGISAAALLGFGLGSEVDVTPHLIARYCGLKNFSTLYGLSWTAYAMGAAVGPVVAGRAFDRAGAYPSSFIMLLSLPCFVGALLTLLLQRYATRTSVEINLDTLVPSPSAD